MAFSYPVAAYVQLDFNTDGNETIANLKADLDALCAGLVNNANLTTPGQACDMVLGGGINSYGNKYASCADKGAKQLAWLSFDLKGVFTENAGANEILQAGSLPRIATRATPTHGCYLANIGRLISSNS